MLKTSLYLIPEVGDKESTATQHSPIYQKNLELAALMLWGLGFRVTCMYRYIYTTTIIGSMTLHLSPTSDALTPDS